MPWSPRSCAALPDFATERIRFTFCQGPRKGPAREFLAAYPGPASKAEALARPPVTIIHEEAA
jgi:hypothetical protein